MFANSLATLSVNLEARLAEFTKDMGQAARVTEKSAAQIGSALGVIKSGLGGLAAGIGIGGIVAVTKRVIDSVDALNDLNDATGASIENLSALEDIGARTGTAFDIVGTSLVKFNAVLKDAGPGNAAGAALKALNLDVKELQSLDPAEALRRTAVALAGFADDGNKARLVQELFGKSVQQVAPFLKDLAEQGKLVAKVTTEQAAEADKFNKQLFQMQKNILDVARYLSSDLVSAINGASDAFRNGGLFSGLKALYGGSAKFQQDKEFSEAVGRQIEIETELQELRKRGFSEDSRGVRTQLANLAAVTNQIRILRVQRAEAEATGVTAAGPARPGLPSVSTTTGGSTRSSVATRTKEIENSSKALDVYIAGLERTKEREQDLTEVQRAQIRIAEIASQRLSESGRNYIPNAAKQSRALELAQEVDRQRELVELIREAAELDAGLVAGESAAQDAIAQRIVANQQRVQQLLGATDTGKFAAIQEDVSLLAAEFQKFIDTAGQAGISQEQYIEAVQARVGTATEEIAKSTEKVKTFAEEVGLTFQSSFESAVVSGKNLGEVLKGLGQDLLQLTVRKSITEPLGGFFSKALTGLLSFDGGGHTGSGSRSGGIDGKGGFLGVLHPDETVIDHTKGGGARAVTININQNVGDIVSMSMLQKNNRQLTGAIRAEMMRSQQYGGALAA